MPQIDKRKGLTLKKMLNESLIIDLNNAKEVSVLTKKFTVSAKGRKAVIGTCQSTPERQGDKKDKWKCSIIGLEDDGPLSAQRCMVSCPCQRFNYGGFEYALSKVGAAKIKYGDGTPPHVMNPNLICGICKHLISLARDLIKRKL
jgi:hypothetical protein